MGNTIAIKLLTEHGQEVICDSRAHLLDYELSMMAWFSGCLIRAIPTERGLLSAEEVSRHIRPVSPYSAPTGAVAIEQTHNMAGGTVYPMRTVCEICDGAHERGVRVHMDGARIFNASAALGIPVHEIAAHADTVMFCLSKALGAPAGSMLAGPADLIAKGAPLPQAAGRRHAAGGHPRRGRPGGAGRIAREACAWIMPTRDSWPKDWRAFPEFRWTRPRWTPISWYSISRRPASRPPMSAPS